MMWTSADTNREAYTKRLKQLIIENAERLADASDVQIEVDGERVNKAHLLLDELIDQAHDIGRGNNGY